MHFSFQLSQSEFKINWLICYEVQEAVITLVYSAAIWFTGCVQNFGVFCGKIKENLNQNPICRRCWLLNRYPYENSEIIVRYYSIEVLSKLWFWESHLPFVCIGTFLKTVNFDIFGRIAKIGRWLPRPDCTTSANAHPLADCCVVSRGAALGRLAWEVALVVLRVSFLHGCLSLKGIEYNEI